MDGRGKKAVREKTHGERLEILERLENWLETPTLAELQTEIKELRIEIRQLLIQRETQT